MPRSIDDARGLKYHMSRTSLGKGAFGEVWLGMHADGSMVAIKSIPLGRADAAAIDELVSEVHLMTSMKHDSVVQYLGSAVVNLHVLIIMEYLPGGSLAHVMGKFGGQLPDTCMRRFAHDVLSGLVFLHDSAKIVHRDLKPANTLCTIDGLCKLADFGTSAEFATRGKVGGRGAPVGTPLYMAPEQARGECTPFSDVWAFGLTLVELATGTLGQWAETAKGFAPFVFIRRLGNNADMVPAVPEGLQEDLTVVVAKCLVRDAAQRPSAKELLDMPFFL